MIVVVVDRMAPAKVEGPRDLVTAKILHRVARSRPYAAATDECILYDYSH